MPSPRCVSEVRRYRRDVDGPECHQGRDYDHRSDSYYENPPAAHWRPMATVRTLWNVVVEFDPACGTVLEHVPGVGHVPQASGNHVRFAWAGRRSTVQWERQTSSLLPAAPGAVGLGANAPGAPMNVSVEFRVLQGPETHSLNVVSHDSGEGDTTRHASQPRSRWLEVRFQRRPLESLRYR
jgi:hypothetical protein